MTKNNHAEDPGLLPIFVPREEPRQLPTLAEEMASGNPWLRYERLKREWKAAHPVASQVDYQQAMMAIAARVIPTETEEEF